MELKVGDKVRVKSIGQINTKMALGMGRYCGEICTIESISKIGNIFLKEDKGFGIWQKEWLEPIEQEENKLNLYYIYEPGHYEIYPKENGMFIKKHGEVEQLTITSIHDSDITKLKEENERLINGIEDLQMQLHKADLLIVELQSQLPKFKIEQEVWYMEDNHIKKGVLKKIEISEYGILYAIGNNFCWENVVFNSIQELIDYLIKESE